METIIQALTFLNDNILWGIPMIIAILATGILLTVRTKALQVRKFKTSVSTTIAPTVKSIFKPKKDTKTGEKTVSQFEAFSAAISGTVGTGNIIGVAGAMLAGGPGAVFWMWVSAFFGLVTNYSENVLGLYYRKKDKDGNISGGPMYYISEGLHQKWLAVVFAVCCVTAALGMGMVQANSISGTIKNTIAPNNTDTQTVIAWIVGAVLVLVTALIVIGGIKRIGKVASMIVPFMALLFIICALIIIVINIKTVPAAFGAIFASAFSFKSITGGLFGYAIMKGMRYGFARGIFSNEAGLGSSVIAHSASDTKEPVKQGLWGVFEVFLDTFVICTLTAVSLLSVGAGKGIDFADIAANAGMDKNVVAGLAFTETFGTFGSVLFSVILPLFAFTTILAWSYYGQKAAEFLGGQNEKLQKVLAVAFKVCFVGLLLVAALVKSDFVWLLDDIFNGMMALPNLAALICLSGLVAKISKNYFDRKKGIAVAPMLSAYPERNEELAAQLSDED